MLHQYTQFIIREYILHTTHIYTKHKEERERFKEILKDAQRFYDSNTRRSTRFVVVDALLFS